MDEYERIQAFYKKHGKEPPKHFEHGTEEDIANNMKRLRPEAWKLEGNQLVGETEFGTLRQTVPTDMILTGTDEDGRPIFKKVVLS